MELAAILAIDSNYGLGYKNNILFKDPIDMKHFRTITSKYVNCVVGRKTAQSLPTGLPGRYLKVLTKERTDSFSVPPTYESVINSLVRNIVIGGNEIYKLFKDDIDIWYVTYFKKAANNVDVYLDSSVINVIEDKNKTREVMFENDDLIIFKIT